ncbi:MAG: hypothetical protein ACFBSF_09985, partial [Leptolyngbyaceae cyanobacterium]
MNNLIVMNNLAAVVSGTVLIVGSWAAPASAFSFLVQGSFESTGSVELFGLVDESFDLDFGFSETIDNNDFGISDEELVDSLADGNVTLPYGLVNQFLPFDFGESLGLGELDLINYDGSLAVGGVGEFGIAFNASDPDNPAFDLTPIGDSDVDLGLCLTAVCALSGGFAADLGTEIDLGFFDTSAEVGLAGTFELSTTPLSEESPNVEEPPEPEVPEPEVPEPEVPEPEVPEPEVPEPEIPEPEVPEPEVPEPEVPEPEEHDQEVPETVLAEPDEHEAEL